MFNVHDAMYLTNFEGTCNRIQKALFRPLCPGSRHSLVFCLVFIFIGTNKDFILFDFDFYLMLVETTLITVSLVT